MSNLSHLEALEAEAIYIIREVAAECEKPVMLYSIGKDSSVMLHLALKAFYPEKPPFPFLHVNTTWKFHEMIEFRDAQAWDPKNQRPEMWKLYNTQINRGESIRVFPISNWTETDIWEYIRREGIEIVPLYFAKERPCIEYQGNLIMVDDHRIIDHLHLKPEDIMHKKIRFRTLGCYPLTGGIESEADTLDKIVTETPSAVESERTSRVIDKDGGAGSMEKRKREGYF